MHPKGLVAGVELPPALCHDNMCNHCDSEKVPWRESEACFFSFEIIRTVAKSKWPVRRAACIKVAGCTGAIAAVMQEKYVLL